MKIFSFASSMEAGIYNGKEKYKSGKLKVDDATISDWNRYGWGKITYDEGFMGSSNVAASKLALKLGRAKLIDYYHDLGFGTKTGISLPNESDGIINFRYNTEVATASFGQGITVTAVQMLQALTTLGNKGVMLKPYLVKKIVDADGNIVLENHRTEIRQVFSEETVNKTIELMRGVVDGTSKISTGTDYKIKGYDLVGKTGTAEISSSKGGYLKGNTNYVKSFAGVFPGNDPQIIVYVAASKMKNNSYLSKSVKHLVKNVGTYLNIYGQTSANDIKTIEIDNYVNTNTQKTVEILEKDGIKPIVIGSGEKIIKQFPVKGDEITLNNKVFLLTNKDDYNMIDITGWSRSEVSVFTKFINLDTTFDGFGYVKSFNIKVGDPIKKDDTLEVKLESKYK